MSGAQSMADALSSKWDEMEASTEEAPEVEAQAADSIPEDAPPLAEEPPAPETPSPTRARSEDGKFAPTPKPPKGGKPPQGAPAAAEPVRPTGPRTLSEKPPPSWMPVAREEWAKLPQTVQDQIKKREAEVSRLVADNTTARQTHTELNRVLAPFVPHLQAAGVQPLKHVETMFRTDYQLRTAPKPQQAAIMAGLIAAYGVDLEALNDALIKGGGAQPATARQAEEVRDRRLDPILAQLKQHQETSERRAQAARAAEVTAFEEHHEHFDAVRNTMSRLFAVYEAAVRDAETSGEAMPEPLTLEKAYQQALTFPEHAGIMAAQQQRKSDEQKKTQAAAAAKARHASGSVQSQGAPPQPAKRGTVRDELEQGWARLEGQR